MNNTLYKKGKVDRTQNKSCVFVCLSMLLFTIITLITGCSNKPSSITYFPVQNEPHDSCPAGLIEGKLILDDGSLRLTSKYVPGENATMIIWPYGYTYRMEKKTIQVLDSDGQLYARVGDELRIGGGGGGNIEFVNSLAHPSLPENCSDPYWIACGTMTNDTLDLEKAGEKLGLPKN